MGMANTFKALSDPLRREILTLLRDGRMNAGELAEKLNITPAALSYHLKLLKSADLVIEYKEKNFIYFEHNASVFDELVGWLKQFGGGDYETENNVGSGTGVADNSSSRGEYIAGADTGTL